MRTLTITFTPCSPEPANGYKIFWRKAGTDDAYTETSVEESPAIINDETGEEGDDYEGYIQSDCGDGNLGNEIPFDTSNPEFNLFVQNAFDQDGNEITGVDGIVYEDEDMDLPIPGGTTMKAVHSGTTDPIMVTVIKPFTVPNCCLRLFKNGVLQECIAVPTSGGYSFAPVVFIAGDECLIMFFDTTC